MIEAIQRLRVSGWGIDAILSGPYNSRPTTGSACRVSDCPDCCPAAFLSVSANGAAPGIPVEVIANGLVLVHAKVNDHPGWFIVDNAVQGFVADRITLTGFPSR